MTGRKCILSFFLLAGMLAPQGVNAQQSWVQQSPSTHPAPLLNPGMAWDPLHQVTVLFSGTTSNGTAATTPNDTWLWNGQQANWTLATPAHKPPGRLTFGMAYDELHNQMVIFGGATQNVFGDTWVWDGMDWTQKFPATSPPARFATSMVYDAARQQVVLFGGGAANGTLLADTWTWDGANWTQQISAASPGARINHQMIYDRARQEVVLFGGNSYTAQFSDTWVWDGSTWILRNPATKPQALRFHAMAYDSGRQQTVLFGGYGSLGASSETWLWDGVNWTQFTGATPSPRYDMGMAYDALNQQTVVFGGNTGNGIVAETWTFGGGTIPVNIAVPPGVQFTFNGQSYTGSQTIGVAPGTYTLATSSPQATATGTQALFSSWSDGGAQLHTVTVGASAVNIAGRFQTQHLLTTLATPANGGTVTASAVSQNGPYYNAGTLVSVFESPAAGSAFTGWSGACAGNGACFVTMNGPATVGAAFSAGPFPVTIITNPIVPFTLNGVSYTGSVTVALAVGSYQLSTPPGQITTPGTELAFVNWSDGGARTHSIQVTGPMSVSAFFNLEYSLSATASPFAGGIVFALGGPWYTADTIVNVEQIPSPGYTFTNWSGDCTGSGACSVKLNSGPGTVTANYTVSKYNLTVVVPAGVQYSVGGFPFAGTQTIPLPSGSYSLALNSPQQMGAGTQVSFASWSDGGAASHAINLGAANLSVNGTFNTQYLLSTTAIPAGGGTVGAGGWYNAGTVVFPVPFAAPGYNFQYWSGACSGSGACAPVMTAPLSIAANFTLPLDWVQLLPASTPTDQLGNLLVWDAARGQTVLFAGSRSVGQTWVFDGANWTQEHPVNSPAPRESAGFAYDSGSANAVLFGGLVNGLADQNDTWIWDGAQWTQKAPAHSPPARDGHALAYDAARKNTILFGGSTQDLAVFNDVWVWDGSDWIQRYPVHVPPGRQFGTLAYDAARQVVVLFGGVDGRENFLGDTWIWDGTDWHAQTPLNNPPARSFHVMTYDAARQQVLLFGGAFGSTALTDTWVWDGTNWMQRTPPHTPPSRIAAAMTFDALHQQPVLFGGFSPVNNAPFNDTWVWVAPAVNLVPQAPTAVNDGQGSYLITVTLKNQGNTPLTALTVSGAKLGSVSASSFSGAQFIAAIEPGATGSFTAMFPIASIAGKSASVSFQGFYSGAGAPAASWSASARSINLP